jgi:LysM repeat protein
VNQKLYLPSGANSSNSSYVEPSTSFVSSSPVVSSGDQYSVSKGDTLSRIARMYGVSVSSLKSANSLSSDRIYVGQKLVIPAGGSSGGYSAPSKGSSSPDPVSYKPSGNGSVYVVQKGDTLGTIAKMHGFTINELARMNNLADPNRLRVGQRLTVSGSQSSAASASGSSMIDDISTSTFTPKVSKPAPTPVKIEDEPLFDPDLKLDLNKKDIINDNFFEQDLDIPVVDVIKSDDSQ